MNIYNELLEIAQKYSDGKYTKRSYGKHVNSILELNNFPSFILKQKGFLKLRNIYKHIFGDNSSKCKVCLCETRFIGLKEGFNDTCSKKCNTTYNMINMADENDINNVADIIYRISTKASNDNLIDAISKFTDTVGIRIDTKLTEVRDIIRHVLNYPKCEICKSDTTINIPKINGKYFNATCSSNCKNQLLSISQTGESNSCHKMSNQTRKESHAKISKKLKSKIANGEFTPNVTNSWARSRCIVKINRDGEDIIVKCRSSWDAYFQLANPNLLYEKIRIPYFIDGEFHNYIIDFVDVDNKVIYEIKPDGLKETRVNQIKFKAAKEWAKLNEFEFRVISNKWFKDNYSDKLLKNQVDAKRLKRLLSQFEG